MTFDLHFSHVTAAEVAAAEKICDSEIVNRQESNSVCFVPLSAGAHRARWRLNELERFVLPSGCYRCYKCSGPHSHTLSPLNNPNTARHPHRYHLIAFFFAFIAMATAIRADCMAGISFKRNHSVQWLFFRSFTTYLGISGATFLSLLRRCLATRCLHHRAPVFSVPSFPTIAS